MGKALGVDEKWVYNIVKQVGNYGESFDRNVGIGLAAQDPARPECAVDPGRPAVRPADPLRQERWTQVEWDLPGCMRAIPSYTEGNIGQSTPARTNRIRQGE